MKKVLFTLCLVLSAMSARAMGYEQARNEAWYLTDKMAYELNLTPEQFNLAYEINLDYLLGLSAPADLYGPTWRIRNDDLRFVLFDWQYNLYLSRLYFYRPLMWRDHAWRLALYDRYRRDYFYFSRPVVVNVYRGRASVRRGPRSPYADVMIRRGEGMRHAYYPDRPRDWRGYDPGRIAPPRRERRPDYNRPRRDYDRRPDLDRRQPERRDRRNDAPGNVFARPDQGRANFGPAGRPRRAEQPATRSDRNEPRGPQARTARPQTQDRQQADRPAGNSRMGGSRSR